MNDLMPVNKITGPQSGALSKERAAATMTSADLANIAGPSVGATSYTPDDNALTSKTLTKLLNTDSPWMQQARTRAAQYSATRGLNNSSIAAGAGESAAIDAAMPIAQADANAFFTSQRDNAAASNQFGLAQNQFMRQGALSIAGAGWDQENRQADMAFRSGEADKDRTFTTGRDEAQRAYGTSERLSSQGFTSGENAADRTFRSGERAAGQAYGTSERVAGQGYTTTRDAAQFTNRLTEISAQTDSQLKVLDAQNGTNLYGSYRDASRTINDQYASAAQRIQESDMDPDVKAAQLTSLQRLTEGRQTFANTIYSNSPKWADEWAKFSVSWDGEHG